MAVIQGRFSSLDFHFENMSMVDRQEIRAKVSIHGVQRHKCWIHQLVLDGEAQQQCNRRVTVLKHEAEVTRGSCSRQEN